MADGVQGELVVSSDGKVYELPAEQLTGHEVSASRLQELVNWAKSQNAATEEVNGYYYVRPGDTMWGLAQRYYGDGSLWPLIWLANAGSNPNPNLIYSGQYLNIPT